MSASESTPLVGGESKQPVVEKPKTFRGAVFDSVEGSIDSPAEYALLLLIFLNVAALAYGTMLLDQDCWGKDCVRLGDEGSPYDAGLEQFELFSVVIFTVEYLCRLWSCIEMPEIAAKGEFWGRVHYGTTFFLTIDFLSIAPYWIMTAAGSESPDFVTALRVFRLIRLLKAEKYLNAFSLLSDVLQDNKTLLIASSFYAFLIWVLSAAALHLCEKDNEDEDTAVMYSSIPMSLYPSLLMLTGNVADAKYSPLGRMIIGLGALVGVAIFAIPSALLASGFMNTRSKTTNTEFPDDM